MPEIHRNFGNYLYYLFLYAEIVILFYLFLLKYWGKYNLIKQEAFNISLITLTFFISFNIDRFYFYFLKIFTYIILALL